MIEIKVPELSESVSEATLLEWHKPAGSSVSEGEVLVEVETDKITMEIYAPASGVLQAILIQAGSDVKSGEVLAQIAPAGEGEAASQPASQLVAESQPAAPAPQPAAAPVANDAPVMPSARKIAEEQNIDPHSIEGSGKGGRVTKGDVLNASGAPAASNDSGEINAMPAAQKIAEEHGIDLASVQGTGADGRIMKRDVMQIVNAKQQAAAPAAESQPAPQPAAPQAAAPASQTSALTRLSNEVRQDRRVPMTKLRMRIAERLLHSQHSTASLTTFNEVNMQSIIDLRKQYRDAFEKKHGVKMGFMSFFVRATVAALKEYPIINASVDGNDIVYHDYYDIGVAVGSKRGLVVPILRDADILSFSGIETSIADFGERAQSGGLSLDEITGGTFSITNGGVFGSMLSTPIINPPQSAILGIHATKMRPVVEADGSITARPMCYFALSYDHRIIDGREAVLFLVAVKSALEDPMRLLIEV